MRKGREDSYRKLKKSPEERHTQKLEWYVLTITDAFLNQKRVNVCEHAVMTCSHTFTLFWSRKTSVIAEICRSSFCVFVCDFHLEFSLFFSKSFLLFSPLYFKLLNRETWKTPAKVLLGLDSLLGILEFGEKGVEVKYGCWTSRTSTWGWGALWDQKERYYPNLGLKIGLVSYGELSHKCGVKEWQMTCMRDE